ncbi:hypothetical protein C4D60_Mb05t15010 [Musa balbisiana]|uniref:Uncharacterized protein n=1 Tax=Musa balbisiana TaxID=52838 RepID=A0A4S8JW99_MUSBA|nr:hypothetical protein C4D60_Mb05t15010 [Musa balbisiana]
MARDLSTLPSEALLGKSAKSLTLGLHYAMALMDRVRYAGRVIGDLSERNSELRCQVEEIRAKSGPEAVAAAEKCAVDLEAEVECLKSELQTSEGLNKELQKLLRVDRAELRLLRSEACTLNKKLEEAKAEAKVASEALAEETHLQPKKDKEAIETYKKFKGFELGQGGFPTNMDTESP